MRRSRALRTISGIAISGVCLWLAFRSVSVPDVGRILLRSKGGWLLLAVVVELLSIVARSQRWVVLLDLKGRLVDSFWVQSVGYLFNNLLPFRMGEPARIFLMAERCRLTVVQVIASVLIERLLDMASVLVLLLVILPWMQVPAIVLRTGAVFAVLVVLMLALLLLLAHAGWDWSGLIASLGRRFPWLPSGPLQVRFEELLLGMQALRSWRPVLGTLFWSLMSWAFTVAMYGSVLRSFQAEANLLEASFLVVTLSLAVSLPSSPGFIGVFHYVGRLALMLPFGVKYDAATAVAIVVTSHLVYYLITTLLGVIGLWRLGETFGGIWHTVREQGTALRIRFRRAESQ
jgi:hypothetical protein